MTSPVPILFTIPNFTTAGSGRAMLNIVERLDRRRFSPAICAARRGARLEAEIDRMNIPFLDVPFTVPARPATTLLYRAYRAAVPFRAHRFALWHSFHYLDDYTEPLIARFAGTRRWIYTKKNMSWNRRSWYLRTLLASRVAAQNTDMLRRFFATAPLRRRAVLVPRGVDTERFRPGVAPRLALRPSLGVSPEAFVIACVAQILPVKGHPTLIDAVARVPRVEVWLAGRELDEKYASELRRRICEAGLEGRVRFLGEIQDVPALLAEIDAFVLPTWDGWRMEGCPVALLEAMSSGLPCVATDIPGSRDIVEPEVSGLLVPARDAVALANALARLARDPARRRELGDAARQRVCDRYAIDREVRAHEDLYEQALGAKCERAAA